VRVIGPLKKNKMLTFAKVLNTVGKDQMLIKIHSRLTIADFIKTIG
jgi:hypothetical protein